MAAIVNTSLLRGLRMAFAQPVRALATSRAAWGGSAGMPGL